MAVIIGNAEDLPKVATNGQIRPFVSARVNGMALTTNTKTNARPKFNAKLQFPLFYPILNNKITIRIWSAKGGLKQNMYIANIPEHPSMSDCFNLTKLLAQDGSMPCRWFNLYGTEPLERSSKTRSRTQGSQYLGRWLVAFSLISNDRPQLKNDQTNPMREPNTRSYQLWVDMYDLVGCEVVSDGSPLWCIISIGPKKSGR